MPLQETVFTCSSFSVHRDGKGRHYVEAPDGVGIIAIDDTGRILMTREYRPKLDRVIWRIPAGKAEKGENFLQTAHRELREESGFDARDITPFLEYDSSSSMVKRRKAFLVARGLFESPLDTGDEEIAPEIHFMAPKDVLRLLNEGDLTGDVAAALYRFLHVEKLV